MSRYVLGMEGMQRRIERVVLLIHEIAMKKMAASNVLIVGLQGLGVEIGNKCNDYFCGGG